ncbi:hypothetical protein Tco_0458423 [Tanacetum coccineum]
MANAVANAMIDDNMRKKAASEKLKVVLDELMKLDFPSGDVLHAGEIFAANKDKMDLFMSLPKTLQAPYVLKLIGLSSGETCSLSSVFSDSDCSNVVVTFSNSSLGSFIFSFASRTSLLGSVQKVCRLQQATF